MITALGGRKLEDYIARGRELLGTMAADLRALVRPAPQEGSFLLFEPNHDTNTVTITACRGGERVTHLSVDGEQLDAIIDAAIRSRHTLEG